jgi:CO/xanthine dehydrogenase FAD-binding subunit
VKKNYYLSPNTLDEALFFLDEHKSEATILAGGTDLIPRMWDKIICPSCFIDIHQLPLDFVRYEDKYVIIGARVTHTQVIDNTLLKKHLPLLIEACSEIAAPPIRNRGTIGGNLVNASPAADTAPAFLVSDADLVLHCMGSKRCVPVSSFFIGPGKTVIKPGEILTELKIPLPEPKTATKYIKLGLRNALAISIVSIAAKIAIDDDGRITSARIALGSVAPIPIRAVEAEATLVGQFMDTDLIRAAANIASHEASPISDIRASAEYRHYMVEVLTRRILISLFEQLRYEDAQLSKLGDRNVQAI